MLTFILKLFTKPKIKGNIRANGEKVYHLPSGYSYKYVKAEKMFYTQKEAKKAGYKKSKR